jgi:hypothetical protein
MPHRPAFQRTAVLRAPGPRASMPITPAQELAIFILVEPRALNVEEVKSGETGECERVYGELTDGLVSSRVGLVVEDMDGAVSHLEKINVSGDEACTFTGWCTV